jgi:uncharacterized membrane protein
VREGGGTLAGVSHSHDHGVGDAAVSRHARRVLSWVALVLGVLTVVGLVVLWPRHDVRLAPHSVGSVNEIYGATTVKIQRNACATTGPTAQVPCNKVTFRLDQGPDKGKLRTIQFSESVSTPNLAVGDKVVLGHIPNGPPGFKYVYSDRQRRPALLLLVLVFAAAIIALGRWRGVAALIGLGASIAVILQFLLPSMLDGNSPQLVAIVGASAVAFLALYISNGFSPMTTVALLGTLSALALTVVLATLFSNLAHLTGQQSEDALLVRLGTANVDLKGLVLAGMVLGALGALNDITVTQASAVGELRVHNPLLSRPDLYRSGLRIGRDHISSTVNTLALAYAGAALPLLLLFALSRQSLGTVANGEVVAVEIIATLVGSIGLVAAVPVSTGLAVLVANNESRNLGRPARPSRARRDASPEETLDPVVREGDDLLAPQDRDFWADK